MFSYLSVAFYFTVLHVLGRCDCIRYKELGAMTGGCVRDRQGCDDAFDDFQAPKSAGLRHRARKQRLSSMNDIVVHPPTQHTRPQ